MIRRALWIAATIAAAVAARAPAQTALSRVIVEDSLTPAKKQLRNEIAELRDTLTLVQASHALIGRARRSGMDGVVISEGRQLVRRCRVSLGMVKSMNSRVAALHTNADEGDRALSSYRGALDQLSDDLTACITADSTALMHKPTDLDRIDGVATDASASVDRYNATRDALLNVLGIRLPVRGNVYH